MPLFREIHIQDTIIPILNAHLTLDEIDSLTLNTIIMLNK